MLRSPLQNENGIHIKDWGAFAGQLVLRTFDRAQRVYQAMCVRGFTGEYNTGERIYSSQWSDKINESSQT